MRRPWSVSGAPALPARTTPPTTVVRCSGGGLARYSRLAPLVGADLRRSGRQSTEVASLPYEIIIYCPNEISFDWIYVMQILMRFDAHSTWITSY